MFLSHGPWVWLFEFYGASTDKLTGCVKLANTTLIPPMPANERDLVNNDIREISADYPPNQSVKKASVQNAEIS
jgi:hypothetical protein